MLRPNRSTGLAVLSLSAALTVGQLRSESSFENVWRFVCRTYEDAVQWTGLNGFWSKTGIEAWKNATEEWHPLEHPAIRCMFISEVWNYPVLRASLKFRKSVQEVGLAAMQRVAIPQSEASRDVNDAAYNECRRSKNKQGTIVRWLVYNYMD